MRHLRRSEIVAELEWHFEQPGKVYLAMTEAERREVASKGFLTKDLCATIRKRIEQPS